MTPRTFTAYMRDGAFFAGQLSRALREAARKAPTSDVEFDAHRISEQARELARLLEARAKT